MAGLAAAIIGFGTGSELRRPLGVAIADGLLLSQVLTLYMTPVVFLALERVRTRAGSLWARTGRHAATVQPAE
ncbi:hypothetical protein BH10PSE7_BH10PSE7_21560 [soil metagenome]